MSILAALARTGLTRSVSRLLRRTPRALGGAGAAIGGVGAGVAALPAIRGVMPALGRVAPLARRALPGVGLVATGAALPGMFAGDGRPRRRRRARGITAAELRGFKRTARILRDFTPTIRRIPAAALRGRKRCST